MPHQFGKKLRARRGYTLVEQTVVIAVVGIITAFAIRAMGQALDALAVHGATRDVRDVFAT
ncbi:MAG: type II secretion system protein, partial [Gemmatimonadaceae bacterium]